MSDDSGTAAPTQAPHEHAPPDDGPPPWLVLATLFVVLGMVAAYQAYLGDLAASAWAAARDALPRLALAGGILLVAFGLIGALRSALRRAVPEPRRQRTLGAMTRYAIYAIAAVAALAALAPGELTGFVLGLGLIGFGLTLALQTPILGVVGWLLINVQGLYAVGDRIRVGEARGDVLQVGLLATVLWEIEGQLGRPTGRRISFGNHLVLQEVVVNYSADLPYNWNDIEIPVAKEGDWHLARDILLRAADEVVGRERMAARVAEYEQHMARNALRYELPRHPTVNMRLADDHSFLILRLRYLVHLDEQSVTRTRLLDRIWGEFQQHPARLPLVYTRNQQMALDRYGMPANAWGPQDQAPQPEPDEAEPGRVEAVPRDR